MSQALGIDITLSASFDQAIERVTAALKDEGFGILTRIDVHQALREKLDVAFRPYAILGACNPQLAHRALTIEPQVGLMLPCNVVVEEAGPGRMLVRLVNAGMMFAVGGFDAESDLRAVAEEAGARLQRVAAALRAPA